MWPTGRDAGAGRRTSVPATMQVVLIDLRFRSASRADSFTWHRRGRRHDGGARGNDRRCRWHRDAGSGGSCGGGGRCSGSLYTISHSESVAGKHRTRDVGFVTVWTQQQGSADAGAPCEPLEMSTG